VPADERPQNATEQSANDTSSADNPEVEEKKGRSGLTTAAAGVAGAAAVGTAAGAAVGGVQHVLGDEDDDGEDRSSLDVFEDLQAGEDAEDSTDESDAGEVDLAGLTTTRPAPLAPAQPDLPGTTSDGTGDDSRRIGPRGDSNTPTSSATADATLIAATETGSTGVGSAASVTPTAPLINRTPSQPEAPAAPPPPPPTSQAGFEAGPATQPAPPAPVPPPANPAAASPGETVQPIIESPASSTSTDSNGIDVIDDVVSSTSGSSSSPVADAPASEEITPSGPASLPDSESMPPVSDSGSSASSDSETETGTQPDSSSGSSSQPDPQSSGTESPSYGHDAPGQQADPGYGAQPPQNGGHAPDQQADPGYGMHPPPHHTKPPVKDDEDDDYQDAAPPPHYDDQVDDQVVDDVIEDPVYDPYYDPFPGNKGYGHPQDLYGDPQPPGPNQAANVFVYRGEQGQDYATIIRDDNGNETITWWYGDPPDGHVVYQVYVDHDGYGNYTEQITSYPVGEVYTILDNIYPNDELRFDPDVTFPPNSYEEVIEQHVIIRTWTDDDGNMVIKRVHRDGSGKVEITYGDGVHVVYQQGQYAYYQDGELIGGEEYVAEEPVDAEQQVDDPVEGDVHPLAGGPDYFVEEGFVNPFTAGFDQIGEGDHIQFVDPQTGANIFATYQGDGTYLVGWRTDPDTPPGSWDLLVKMDQNGNYNVTHYTGDVEIETIGPLGYVPVDGEPYQDPWNTYGFPADNASQIVSEDTVVQTWETADGPITKTFYRDGSFKTVIEYPDGVVITYDPNVNPYPTYETPDGQADEGEPYVGVEGAFLPPTAPDFFEYNGVTYPNPEADDSYTYEKTEGPFGTPGGTVVQHHYVGEDGYLIIVSVHSDGQYEITYGDPNIPMADWDMRIVMQPDGSYAPLPQYMVEDEAPVQTEQDVEPAPDGVRYFGSDLFGETYGHPADLYPNGPSGSETIDGVQYDYYPDGTRYAHTDPPGIIWYDAQGNPMLGASVLDNGYQIDVLPWPHVLDTYGTVLEPVTTSHGTYYDPARMGETYQQEVMYGAIKHTYPDGTEKVYLTGAQDPGWIQINYPDGTVVVWNGSEAHVELEGSGEYALPFEDEDTANEPAWLMGGPEAFDVGGGVTFPNPEYDNEFTYTGSSPDGTQHYYEDSNGYKAVIVQGENQHTVWYGQNPPAQNDLVIRVNAYGEHEIDYYPAGEAQAQPDESAEEAEADAFEAWTAHLPGYFPIDGASYVNPEAYLGGNNTFTLIDESETQRIYESNGYLVRITEQPGGMYSFEWGSELGNPDLAIDVNPDGSYTVMYSAADVPEEPVQSQSLGTAIPINFAEEAAEVDEDAEAESESTEEAPLFNAEKVLEVPEVEAQPESIVSREAMVQLPADPDPQPEVEHQEFSSISPESEDAAEDIDDDDDDDPTGP
jgi:hypothetical protein